MNALLSEEMELRRQFEQLNWMEEFLEYSKDRVAPTDALQVMRMHVVARQTLERMWKEPRLDSIKADIVLSGNMSVSLESDAAAASALASGSTAVVETKTAQKSGAAPQVSSAFYIFFSPFLGHSNCLTQQRYRPHTFSAEGGVSCTCQQSGADDGAQHETTTGRARGKTQEATAGSRDRKATTCTRAPSTETASYSGPAEPYLRV